MDGSKTAVKGGTRRAAVPSVDRLLRDASFAALIEEHGRKPVTEALRDALDALRAALGEAGGAPDLAPPAIAACVAERLVDEARPSLRRVFNLTGTVLHTNLGRAPLPEEAIEAVAEVARGASNLEFDLATGRRGDRDAHVEGWLIRLTGAEAATVVNNNAAAVLLVLNTLARGREVVVSRGELVEIGGAFRIPDVMARAGARMREIGTTNRTHARDYEEAIGPRTALLMKIHTSNYEVRGFTAEVPEEKVAEIAHRKELPMAVDLGSGTLVDLEPFGLPHETTARETVAAGADLVTFSGDKLLGGPQAGMIVGRADLVARCKRNPMKRAMRCDKMTLAALSSVLRLYADPDRLAERVPALRLLARPADEIKAAAQRIAPKLQGRLGDRVTVEIVDCASQIGSGALPVEALPSAGLAIRPTVKRGAGAVLDGLAASFRALPVPVIGRVQDGAFVLDLRCLDDEAAFTGQIARLDPVP